MKKLSQLNADETFNILEGITPYIEQLATDTELIEVWNEGIGNTEGLSKEEIEKIATKIGRKRLFKLIQILLKKHREVIYSILAELKGATVEEIASTNIIVLSKDIVMLCKDRDLIDFFTSFTN